MVDCSVRSALPPPRCLFFFFSLSFSDVDQRLQILLTPRQLRFELTSELAQVFVRTFFSSPEFDRCVDRIDLSDNALEHVPEAVANFPELRKLILRRNRIASLNKSLAMFQISSLNELDLAENGLTDLPEEICKLRNLANLNLENNLLTILPACLAKMTHLNRLRLWGNFALPEAITRRRIAFDGSELEARNETRKILCLIDEYFGEKDKMIPHNRDRKSNCSIM